MSLNSATNDHTTGSPEGFHYTSLSDNQNTIRVVRIKPGAEQDPIHCNIDRIPIVEDAYNCLSYTWGPEHPTKQISIDDKLLPVRENLWNFLHTARRYGFTDPIWIDAICINQADIVEKSAQIKQMGTIYKKAFGVVVWLGLRDDELETLQRYQNLINGTYSQRFSENPKVDAVWSRLFREHKWHELDTFARCQVLATGEYSYMNVRLDKEDLEVLSAYAGDAGIMTSMANSTYWSRAWVVQETALANKAEMLIHDKRVDFWVTSTLFESWGSADIQKPSTKDYERKISGDILHNVRLIAKHMLVYGRSSPLSPTKMSVREILMLTATRHCSDSRDSIYSILPLLPGTDRFEVDYAIDPIDLFGRTVQFVCHSLEASYRLTEGSPRSPLKETALTVVQIFSGLRLHPPHIPSLPALSKTLINLQSGDTMPRVFWADSSSLPQSSSLHVALCTRLTFAQRQWLVAWPIKRRAVNRSGRAWNVRLGEYTVWRHTECSWILQCQGEDAKDLTSKCHEGCSVPDLHDVEPDV